MRQARAWRVPVAASPDAPPTPARVARHLEPSAAAAGHDAFQARVLRFLAALGWDAAGQ